MSAGPSSHHAQYSRTISNQVHEGLEAAPGGGGWGAHGVDRSSVHSRPHSITHT